MECPNCGSDNVWSGSWNQPGQHFCRNCGALLEETSEGLRVVPEKDWGDTEPISLFRESEAVIIYDCPTCGLSCTVQKEGLTCPNGHTFTLEELIQGHYKRLRIEK